jgi:hypothetical protein
MYFTGPEATFRSMNKKSRKDTFLRRKTVILIIDDNSLKVHKNENFFAFDFEFCTISMLVMHK